MSPFDGCPTEAFLFQGSPSTVYAVDLATGQYSEVGTNTGAAGVINAVGFNETDRYIYGWNKSAATITRINQIYRVEDLAIQEGLPTDKSFFVGDVFNNTYFLYLKNSGMFKIDLSQGDDNLVATRIMSAADATLTLTDFAFYPETGELFAVENSNNDLYQFSFDASGNASFERKGSTGLSGTTTFGAQYFDKSGFMYISNNNDGKIYRLDLRNLSSFSATAEFFLPMVPHQVKTTVPAVPVHLLLQTILILVMLRIATKHHWKIMALAISLAQTFFSELQLMQKVLH